VSKGYYIPGSMRAATIKSQALWVTEKLASRGLRLTPQRQRVYEILLEKRDHPTAEEVFMRAKRRMPDISLATVYNCLEALVRVGVAKQIQFTRSAARFCPNMTAHGHFVCDSCGHVYDVTLDGSGDGPEHQVRVPAGFRIREVDLSIRGLCPDCSNTA